MLQNINIDSIEIQEWLSEIRILSHNHSKIASAFYEFNFEKGTPMTRSKKEKRFIWSSIRSNKFQKRIKEEIIYNKEDHDMLTEDSVDAKEP